MAAGGPQSNEVEEEEEKEEKIIFEVKLESYEASSKVKIIKELRKMTDLTLKDVSYFADFFVFCSLVSRVWWTMMT